MYEAKAICPRICRAVESAWVAHRDRIRRKGFSQIIHSSHRVEHLESRLLLAGSVVINELHIKPDKKSELVEFVELTNPGNAAVNLGGAAFTSGISYTFPANTMLQPGGFVVLAQNPAALTAKFGAMPAGVTLLGPYTGKLNATGEDVVIKDSAGVKLDEVDYAVGFPWPTVGDEPGYSLELVNPNLDNNIGGSWRSFVPSADTTLVAGGASWRYRKGTSEASSPTSAWRNLSFVEDGSWLTGAAPIGYDPSLTMGTTLGDMNGNYSSVFLRKTVSIADPATIASLRLEALYDDGFNLWINGQIATSANVPGANLAYNGLASSTRESAAYDTFAINKSLLQAGNNEIAVQFFNVTLSNSSDAFFDARLIASSGGVGPTPGRQNAVFNTNAPPQMRQLTMAPEQPSANQPVTVTMKVTDPDGVGSVSLAYQLVDAGSYIAIEDAAYNAPANWTSVAMHDDGLNGDAVGGDNIYTVVLPASLQVNRRLVRYRITSTDTLGASVRGPYPDDPVQNFAYYVYSGVPNWSGAIQPGAGGAAGQVVNYSGSALSSVPTYQLLTKRTDHVDAQYIPPSTRTSGYTGDNYLWSGTLVYDSVVYDGIHYRARGGIWRYAMGKNTWKFSFNAGHLFAAKDVYGNPLPEKWSKLDLRASVQQADVGVRGEQGLFETLSYAMYNLAGLAAARTTPVAFRIVENASETGATQYATDFQGLYLAVEENDGHFLDAHNLPDGNLYKMERGGGAGGGTLQNQAPGDPGNNADLVAFTTAMANNPSDQYIRDNVDLDEFYSFQAVTEMIHSFDIGFGDNYYYYHNPITNKWQVLPWDTDLTWYVNYEPGNGDKVPLTNPILFNRTTFQADYRSRAREIRDLLFNSGELAKLADAYAARVNPGGGTTGSFVQADRAMWDYNPILVSSYVNPTKAGNGKFYLLGSPTQDYPGMVAKLKSWASTRYTWTDTNVLTAADEAAAPRKTTVSYIGPAGFPATQLKFSTTGFVAGNAGGTFAAMQWRIADVTPVVGQPVNSEITAAWDSGAISPFNASITIPSTVVVPQHTYRVRARIKDSNGRWGHWSDVTLGATEFTVTASNTLVPDNLRVTELNYNPAPFGSTFDAQEFEFIELKSFSAAPLDLTNCYFAAGITFTFGSVSLPAGGVGVVVRNATAFQSRYGTNALILGTYGASGTNFSNGGESVIIDDSFNQSAADFIYNDSWYPSTDGGGPTLQVIAPGTNPNLNLAASWMASATAGGTPGIVDTVAPVALSGQFTFNASPQSLTVRFSEDVQFSLGASDLILTNNTTATTIPAVNISAPNWDAATNSATFTLPGYAGGFLPAGSYTLALDTNGIIDASSNHLAPGFALHFLYAAGTSAGDAIVARLDPTQTTLQVWQNADPSTAPPTYSAAFATLSSFAVDGNAGDDALTLDFTHGEVRPAGANGFGYRLGNGNETLQLTGPIAWSFAADPVLETPSLNLILNNGASAAFLAPATHLASLTVNTNAAATLAAGSGHVLVSRSLSIDATATLDLNDNDMIVDYTGKTQLAAIQSLINSARAGGTWNGQGITSTSAKNATPKNITLGVIEAADFKSIYGPGALFAGESIDSTSVLIKYTYYGDADFNGVVNFDDYSRIDNGFSTNKTGWSNGDFDGNGIVNFDDYSLIDLAFNTQGVPLRAAMPLPIRTGKRVIDRLA